MSVRVEREGRPIELVSDADLAVLNGLDIELERWCRSVEPVRRVRVDPAVEGFHALSVEGQQRLSRYHPQRFGPQRSLRRLVSADLLERRKTSLGVRFYVTADGDALIEDRADELPGPLCEDCWEESAFGGLDPRSAPDILGLPALAEFCESCVRAALEDVITLEQEARRRARELGDYVNRVERALGEAEE